MTESGPPVGSAVLLVGMMGVGKSSVGRELAQRLGWGFLDSDREIERHAGRSIARLFDEEGEERFRQIETEVLRGLPEHRVVIALGGGALVREVNRALLGPKGALVWLDASIETLVARTSADSLRPLLAGLDTRARAMRLRALEAERRSVYAQAKWRVSTDGRTTAEVAEAIVALLGPTLPGPVGCESRGSEEAGP